MLKKILPWVLLPMLSLIVYWPGLWVYFLSDDFIWLWDARNSQLSELYLYYTQAADFFYRPTTKLYFYFGYQFFGFNPLPFHAVNILLHGLVSAGVYFLSKRVYEVVSGDGKLGAKLGLVVALIFLVHPVHMEPVVWISAVTELIPALCIIAILLTPKSLRLYPMLASGLYFLAMGGHEFAIIAPALLLVWQMLDGGVELQFKGIVQLLRKNYRVYLGLLITVVVYLVMRLLADSHWQGGDYSYSLARLPFNVVGNSVAYVFLAVCGSAVMEYYLQLRQAMREQLLFAAMIVLGMLVFGWLARRYLMNRVVILMGSFLVLSLAAFLPLGTITERYVYFGSWVIYVGLIWLIWVVLRMIFGLVRLQREFWGVSAFMVSLFSVMTYLSFNDWHMASAEARALVGFFETQCGDFTENQTLTIESPPNRIGRAWVFQVGAEEAAMMVCDKQITLILR